jgi:hypothetical protein
MVRSVGFSLAFCMVGASLAVAQQPKAAPANQEADLPALASELAKTIFATADANRNRWLSRGEFQHAVGLLDEAMTQWGQQGLLGHARKGTANKSHDEKDPDQAIKELTAQLSKNTRVNEPEFTLYVLNVVDQADRQWQQLRALSDAQRKAYNAYRASLRPRRSRAVTPYPY